MEIIVISQQHCHFTQRVGHHLLRFYPHLSGSLEVGYLSEYRKTTYFPNQNKILRKNLKAMSLSKFRTLGKKRMLLTSILM